MVQEVQEVMVETEELVHLLEQEELVVLPEQERLVLSAE